MLYFGGYSISLLPLHPKTQMGVGPCRSMHNVNSQYEANITIHKLKCSPSPKELTFIKFYEVCIWRWNNRPKVKAEEIKRMGAYRCNFDLLWYPPNLPAGLFFCTGSSPMCSPLLIATTFPTHLLSEVNPSTLQPCLMALHQLILLPAIQPLGIQAISRCVNFTFHLKVQYLNFVFYAFAVWHFLPILENQWIKLISPYHVKET